MKLSYFSLPLGALATACLLSACGGSDSAPTPPAETLSGTAAVGLPIVGGDINITCAGGSPINQTKLTSATGSWTVTLSGQTLPCAVRVSGGNIGSSTGAANNTNYHSIAMTPGTVNITPLTDLVVANLAGKDPATWFSAPALSALKTADIDTALNKIKSSWGLSTALGTRNPITTAFTAQSTDPLDNVLEALAKARATAGLTSHASLFPYVTNISVSTPAGFNFAVEYGKLISPSGGGTSPNTCAATETALTFSAGTGSSPYTNGQTVCFTASSTALAFSGKTLGSPTQNAAVSAPFSAYKFVDGDYTYEVVFNAGALHEINLLSGTVFAGQFAAASTTPPATGNSNLTVSVTVNGLASGTIAVGNVPKPANEAEFCGAIQNDTTFTSIGASGGGTLTINSCSFSGNVGNISATLAVTVPVSLTIPYSVTYTYN